jgi:phospholipase C
MGSPALAAALPANISRALEIPAHRRTGTIADVEHIVVLMQENRSFDHYFGTMRGVRGYADPHVVKLPSGQPVWFQPTDAGFLLPFRPDVENVGMEFLPDPPHGWTDTHAAWNEGRHDQWVPNKGVTTMTYHTRKDIPYHYALADAFTVCDAYHCSLLGPTDPNRYHMWTGWVGNDGNGGGPVITNAEAGYDWSTFPERLERAGISWKIYQDAGIGLDAAGSWGWTDNAYIGNFGDNSLLYFHQFQNAPTGSSLADRAKTGTNILTQSLDPDRLIDIFGGDVQRGTLPQVSWIVAPEAYCEHPNWRASLGAWYVSQIVDVLVSNPDVWSKTVLLINYDEEGGFFDHLVPPTPPQSRDEGLSTVETTNEIFAGDSEHASGPYGLGMRVPLLVVSPWSKGGWVNSQVFDHTSIIRFLEARFGDSHPDLVETNITPWRRAVSGDLTSAFDFARPEAWRKVKLPSTDAYKPQTFDRHDDDVPVPPATQEVPRQERGVRPARALPYVLDARGTLDAADGSLRIDFRNSGKAAVVYHVRSAHVADAPRTYTVEPHMKLTDTWSIGAPPASAYDIEVFGPNGFFRAFKGGGPGSRGTNLDVRARYDERLGVTLEISNRASRLSRIAIREGYSGHSTKVLLAPGQLISKRWSLTRVWGWYDLTITADGDASFAYQLAGHVENDEDSISDPIMGGLI